MAGGGDFKTRGAKKNFAALFLVKEEESHFRQPQKTGRNRSRGCGWWGGVGGQEKGEK